MQILNAHMGAEQIVARLVRDAAQNAASHLLRLNFLSEGGRRSVHDFTGVERDFLISVLYSMNETVGILATTSSQAILDAIALGDPDTMDWYDKAISTMHRANCEDPALQSINKGFEAQWERVRPTPKPPANAKEIEAAFAPEDDDEAIGNDQSSEPALAAAAG